MLLLMASQGVAFAASPAPAAGPQATAATATAAQTPDPELLTRYCVRCHSDTLKTGGLTLEHVDVDRIAEGPRGVGKDCVEDSHWRDAEGTGAAA